MHHRGPRPLTPALQLHALLSRWNGSCTFVERTGFKWESFLRPTALSRNYHVRVCYRTSSSPDVWVLDPDLPALAEGRRLQHVYEQKPTRLCLHLPEAREWTPQLLIADTIVPWAVLWLLYFEDWLVNDVWAGGGKHPGDKDE